MTSYLNSAAEELPTRLFLAAIDGSSNLPTQRRVEFIYPDNIHSSLTLSFFTTFIMLEIIP
jgi:hypothetical protein